MPDYHGIDTDVLAKAVVAWTGYGSAAWPQQKDRAIADLFSEQDSIQLLAAVKTLERDFFQSQAYKTAANLSEMHDAAIADFRHLHPELPDIIGKALGWCYSYDYK